LRNDEKISRRERESGRFWRHWETKIDSPPLKLELRRESLHC
jgi:hypothetical protein